MKQIYNYNEFINESWKNTLKTYSKNCLLTAVMLLTFALNSNATNKIDIIQSGLEIIDNHKEDIEANYFYIGMAYDQLTMCENGDENIKKFTDIIIYCQKFINNEQLPKLTDEENLILNMLNSSGIRYTEKTIKQYIKLGKSVNKMY